MSTNITRKVVQDWLQTKVKANGTTQGKFLQQYWKDKVHEDYPGTIAKAIDQLITWFKMNKSLPKPFDEPWPWTMPSSASDARRASGQVGFEEFQLDAIEKDLINKLRTSRTMADNSGGVVAPGGEVATGGNKVATGGDKVATGGDEEIQTLRAQVASLQDQLQRGSATDPWLYADPELKALFLSPALAYNLPAWHAIIAVFGAVGVSRIVDSPLATLRPTAKEQGKGRRATGHNSRTPN